MLFWVFSVLLGTIQRVVYSIYSATLYLCLAVAVGHYFGWIERWIWCVLEKEGSKILNGATITIGSFRLDWSAILQGKITLHASNVVLHTPQRQVWGWESPLIGRIGKASVEVNAPITIVHEIFFRKHLPLEIYSVFIADVQVFVERHDQVVNVYLCDPAAVLPPPPYLTPPSCPHPQATGEAHLLAEPLDFSRSKSDPLMGAHNDNAEDLLGGTPADPFEDEEDDILLQKDPTRSKMAMSVGHSSEDTPVKEKHKEQAQKMVQDMLQTVQSLGRAARKGSLHTAVKQHGMEMAEKLRDGLSTRNRNTSNLEQGVALMEQVGKVAAESLKAPKLILPERKVGEGGPKPPMARVGRIVLKDARIFTKDSWIQITQDEKNHKTTKLKEHTGAFGVNSSISGSSKDDPAPPLKRGNWNRPIFLENLVVRASELCPSMSLKDENNPDLPAVYQPIDKILEIVWRRLLAEMAKSNGGRLFSTALGEVLSFIQSNPQQTQNSSSNSATISTTTTTVSTTSISTPKNTKKSRIEDTNSKAENRDLAAHSKTPIPATAAVGAGTKLTQSRINDGISTTVEEMTHEVRV